MMTDDEESVDSAEYHQMNIIIGFQPEVDQEKFGLCAEMAKSQKEETRNVSIHENRTPGKQY